MTRWLKTHKQILVTVLLAFVLAAAVICYESTLLEWTTGNVLRMLSDGFFVSGICFVCFGLLMMIAGAGVFDAFAYLVSNVRAMFSPRKSAFSGRMNYTDYRLKKEADREEKGKPPVCVPATGAVFLVVSVVLACWA